MTPETYDRYANLFSAFTRVAQDDHSSDLTLFEPDADRALLAWAEQTSRAAEIAQPDEAEWKRVAVRIGRFARITVHVRPVETAQPVEERGLS